MLFYFFNTRFGEEEIVAVEVMKKKEQVFLCTGCLCIPLHEATLSVFEGLAALICLAF